MCFACVVNSPPSPRTKQQYISYVIHTHMASHTCNQATVLVAAGKDEGRPRISRNNNKATDLWLSSLRLFVLSCSCTVPDLSHRSPPTTTDCVVRGGQRRATLPSEVSTKHNQGAQAAIRLVAHFACGFIHPGYTTQNYNNQPKQISRKLAHTIAPVHLLLLLQLNLQLTTHSFTHSLTHSFTHSPTHSLTHSMPFSYN